MSRHIADHIVHGDKAPQLTIDVLGEPGMGGANHTYEITGFDAVKHPGLQPMDHVDRTVILFQNGHPQQVGLNGITHEALLAVIIDRLRSLQIGQFNTRENAIALTHCEEAMMWLQRRTVTQIKRGVEGA